MGRKFGCSDNKKVASASAVREKMKLICAGRNEQSTESRKLAYNGLIELPDGRQI